MGPGHLRFSVRAGPWGRMGQVYLEGILRVTPTSIEHILGVWEKLGPMERSILNTLAYRILKGQRDYGPLHEKKKDWTWEAAEEGLDQAVYLTCALVALTEESKRRYFQDVVGGNIQRPAMVEPFELG